MDARLSNNVPLHRRCGIYILSDGSAVLETKVCLDVGCPRAHAAFLLAPSCALGTLTLCQVRWELPSRRDQHALNLRPLTSLPASAWLWGQTHLWFDI